MPAYGATTTLDAKIDVQDIIDYAKEELEPWDIFDQDQLVDAVSDHLEPDDVFDEKDLASWATANGFVKVDEPETPDPNNPASY